MQTRASSKLKLWLHTQVQRDLANTETYPEILKEAHLR